MKNKINKFMFISALCLFFVSCAQEPLKDGSKHKSKNAPMPAPMSQGTLNPNESNLPPIKILSIDGGGIRGIIPAHLLAGFEKETGKRVYELFDIVAGTSTGGLIALISTTPNDNKTSSFMPAEEIEKFYIKYADKIFKYACKPWVLKSLCGIAGPLYEVDPFEKLMKDIISDRLFKEALKPTLVATFDIERKQGYSLESDSPLFDNLTKAEVARATSAAPTYFAPKILEMKNPEGGGLSQHYMVDGGLYKNNPSLLAYRKALKIFGADQVKKRGIVLISLGTGWPILNANDGKDLLTAGFAKWAPAAIDAIIDGSSNEDHLFLEDLFKSKPKSTYIRIQALLDNASHPAITELDNIDQNNLRFLVGAAKNTKNIPAYKDAVNMLKMFSGPSKI